MKTVGTVIAIRNGVDDTELGALIIQILVVAVSIHANMKNINVQNDIGKRCELITFDSLKCR